MNTTNPRIYPSSQSRLASAGRGGETGLAPRIYPGAGSRLTATALGYSISANRGGGSFAHPFRPSMSAFGIRFRRGVIIPKDGTSREPTIRGIPISGKRGVAQPVLLLDPEDQNDKGESWACVEVEPDKDGALTAASRVEIIHANHPTYSGNADVGRHPIALIVWQDQRPVICEAIAMFHLRYERFVPPNGAGNVQHFFR